MGGAERAVLREDVARALEVDVVGEDDDARLRPLCRREAEERERAVRLRHVVGVVARLLVAAPLAERRRRLAEERARHLERERREAEEHDRRRRAPLARPPPEALELVGVVAGGVADDGDLGGGAVVDGGERAERDVVEGEAELAERRRQLGGALLHPVEPREEVGVDDERDAPRVDPTPAPSSACARYDGSAALPPSPSPPPCGGRRGGASPAPPLAFASQSAAPPSQQEAATPPSGSVPNAAARASYRAPTVASHRSRSPPSTSRTPSAHGSSTSAPPPPPPPARPCGRGAAPTR